MHDMSKRRRRAWWYAAALCAFHGTAVAAVNQFHAPARPGQQYHTWLQKAYQRMNPNDFGDFHPLHSDEEWVQEYLEGPDNIYSSLHPKLFRSQETTPEFPSSAFAARGIAWDLGLDKGLPGFQASAPDPLEPALAATWQQIRANLIKAGVSHRYYQQAYVLGGPGIEFSTLSAELAVALQVLDDWVRTTDEESRLFMGVRADILERAQKASHPEALSPDDFAYLADILRSELSVFRGGVANLHGNRALSTPLRIARVAAAYRVSQGYGAAEPCHFDGTVNRQNAAMTSETQFPSICTTEATDRAVYEWYRGERARQLSRIKADTTAGQHRLINAFESIRPSWAGVLPVDVLMKSNRAEVIEAQLALRNDNTREGRTRFLQLVERANLVIYPGEHH